MAWGAPALAQEDLSAEGARAAAAAARDQAAAAQAELDRARALLEAAEQRAAEAASAQQEAEAVAAEVEASSPAGQAMEAARAAERRARRAEEIAREAQRGALALEQRIRDIEQRIAYDRTGPYVGVAVAFAPEDFNSGLSADNSGGVSGRVGYRVHSHVALEGRFDWLDSFDVAGNVASGELDPWSAVGGIRVFFLTGRIQPYAGFAGGVMSARLKGTRFADGSTFSDRETEAVFRVGGGLDFYLTPSVVLNLDAAYLGADDTLDDFAFGTLGGGLEFRF